MSPLSAILHILLRSLVLRVVGMLCGVLVVRQARIEARLAGLPVGHRHRARIARVLAEMARVRAALSDPEFWEDPRSAGMAATVARCVNDAGRRAVARLMGLLGACGRGMRVVRAVSPISALLVGRCTGGIGGVGDRAGAWRARRGWCLGF